MQNENIKVGDSVQKIDSDTIFTVTKLFSGTNGKEIVILATLSDGSVSNLLNIIKV